MMIGAEIVEQCRVIRSRYDGRICMVHGYVIIIMYMYHHTIIIIYVINHHMCYNIGSNRV